MRLSDQRLPGGKNIMGFLGRGLDAITLVLILGVLLLILKQIWTLVTFSGHSGTHAIDTILYIVVLMELFIILFHYFDNHHIEVARVVEIGIISLIREIIFKVEALEVMQLFAIATLLLVLGALFYIEKKCAVSEKKL